jgi:hypothetical protein
MRSNYELDVAYKLSDEAVKRFSESVHKGLNYCLAREIGNRPWFPVSLDSSGCVQAIEMADTGRVIAPKDLNCADIKGREQSYVMFTCGELDVGTVERHIERKPVQVEVEPLYLVLERSKNFERASIAYRGKQCAFTLEEAKQMVAELCLIAPVETTYELYKFHGTAKPVVTTVIEVK